MKKLIGILLIGILFSSCLTVRRVERNCDLFAKICGTGTTTEIQYKDTTIFINRDVPVYFPRDTTYLQGQVTIDTLGAQMQPAIINYGMVTITAKIKDSKLTASGYLNRDSLVANIRDSILIKNAIRQSSSKTTVTIREKYIPGFFQFTFWFAIIEWAALLIFGAIKILRMKFIN